MWKSSGTMEATPPRWTAGPILTGLPAEKTKQKPVPPSRPLRSPALRCQLSPRTGTGLFLQGRWTDTTKNFRLIVLDTPQVMELETGDPSPASRARSGEVRLIDVSLAEGLESFDGQHLTFSIDPEETYWPSDASMPVGQPSTRDVHILN